MNNLETVFEAIASARLTIDIIPDTCNFTKIRDFVSPDVWQRIRLEQFADAAHRCEVCSTIEPVSECHEQWEFDDERMRLRLVSLAALCSNCFRVKTISQASHPAVIAVAVFHLARVNQWAEEQARLYIRVALRLWRLRSQRDWQLDVGYLKQKFDIEIAAAPVMTDQARKLRL